MSSKAIIRCVLPRFGGAIWWMLARWRLGPICRRIVGINLAPFVSGSLPRLG